MDEEPKLYRIWSVIGNKKKGIQGIIPMSRASWYAGIKEGRYPKPVKLSERSVAWRKTDIDELAVRLAAGKWQAENQLNEQEAA